MCEYNNAFSQCDNLWSSVSLGKDNENKFQNDEIAINN